MNCDDRRQILSSWADPMEMHQIRYFLAVARTLNFTRAAQECNVAQPSLTRAIKLLEAEFEGDLFRRERSLSHLTELGKRMLPLLQQCYDSAVNARTLATSIKSGEVATLKLGLSRTVNIELLVPHLCELTRNFNGLELKFVRGDAREIVEALKQGDVEVAVASLAANSWDRLDSWPLFSEAFSVVVHAEHPIAARDGIEVGALRHERLLIRSFCETGEQLVTMLRSHDIAVTSAHHTATENDTIGLLVANVGVAVMPMSARLPSALRRIPLQGHELTRTVSAYAVAGRARSVPATTLLKLLRSADWHGGLAAA